MVLLMCQKYNHRLIWAHVKKKKQKKFSASTAQKKTVKIWCTLMNRNTAPFSSLLMGQKYYSNS